MEQSYGINLIPLVPQSASGAQTTLVTFTSAASSARVNPGTRANVRISVTGQPVWIKMGGSGVSATAGTAHEILCPVGHTDLCTGEDSAYIAFIEDAASAKGSIFQF